MHKTGKKIRVLVADDSAFMRKVLSDIINSDPSLEVVGTARNGEEALQKALTLHPDVITLDVEMPVLDGLSTLEKIMEQHPVPVIMLSASTTAGASATITALERGAVDFLAKPGGPVSLDIGKSQEEIINKIKMAAEVPRHKCQNYRQDNLCLGLDTLEKNKFATSVTTVNTFALIAIGTSTGGPRALHEVLSRIPAGLNAALFIVQHMPPGFTKSLAQRLDSVSSLAVKEAEEGDEVKNGFAYIAPGDYHMEVLPRQNKLFIHLHQGPNVNGHRPSVDVLMHSVARIDAHKVGVIMTGMGQDGAQGMLALKKAGAINIGESSTTCVVYGMPKAAKQLGAIDYEVPVHEIAERIVQALR